MKLLASLKIHLTIASVSLAALLFVVPAAQAAPMPFFNAIGLTGPTNLPPAVNEVQRIAVDATGGSFTLTFGGQTTVLLAYDESAAGVEAALNDLSTIGGAGGSVTVSGGPGNSGGTNPYLVTFGGSLATTDVAQLTADSLALTGAGQTATVTTVAGGGAGEGKIAMYVQNIGGRAASGTITGKITLPPGIVTSETPKRGILGLKQINNHIDWTCGPTGAGQSIVTCTSPIPLTPGASESIEVPLAITRGAGTTSAEIEFSGGDTLEPAKYTVPITVSSANAAPGIQVLSAGAYNDDGTPATQAGGHPYSASAAIFGTTIVNKSENAIVPAGNPHNIDVAVPPGFVANPRSTLRCDQSLRPDQCATDETIIGTAAPVIFGFGETGYIEPAVNSVAPKGYPAGFRFEVTDPEVQVNGRVRSDIDYAIEFGSDRTLEVQPVYGSFFTFWGVPADPEHDVHRCPVYKKDNGTQCGGAGRSSIFAPTALVTNAVDCQGHAERTPVTTLNFDVWADIGNYHQATVDIPPVTGCDKLKFAGQLSLQPQKTEAAVPSAFDFEVNIPQDGLLDPDKLVTPELKHTVVKLPPEVSLNPASAAGLGGCTTEQMGLIGTNFGEPLPIRFDKQPVRCPENSKLGTFEIGSPLLDLPLQGIVYLATQDDNPFNTTIALYLVIEDEQTGLMFKLPGKAIPDPVTGQVTSTFPNNPQLPFENLVLHFKGGNLAPLATPETCGTFTTDSEITPWSFPQSGPPFHDLDSFQITSGRGGSSCANSPGERAFKPTLRVGTTSAQAGAFTGLRVKMTREDGEQDLRRLSFTLPKGVSGKLAGIPYCSEGQIAAADSRSGKLEQQSSICPEASRIGSVVAAAGIGTNPYFAEGNLYMSGPYRGAPISTVAIVPAVAGPYDLGNVVVRTPLYINRHTAQVTATSDPLPYILEGIPLHLRSINIEVDRPGFVVNPTSCEKTQVTAQMTGSGGSNVSGSDDVVVNASEPFQVGGCGGLGFKPKFSARLRGKTKRGGLPAFIAEVKVPRGSFANLAGARVTLPHSEFLEQANIRTVCTRVQAAANACPPGSIYGHAEATTPLLDGKLSGPVFLKSSNNKLPDLAIALRGPDSQPIEVEFQGRIDSVKAKIRDTIEGLPDVPVSKFVLRMKRGKKGLLVNSRNLCKGKQPRMTVVLSAQNNKTVRRRPPLRDSCRKKAKKRKKAGKHHRRHKRGR